MKANVNGTNMMYGTGPPILGTRIGVKYHSIHAAVPHITANMPYAWYQYGIPMREIVRTGCCIMIEISSSWTPDVLHVSDGLPDVSPGNKPIALRPERSAA